MRAVTVAIRLHQSVTSEAVCNVESSADVRIDTPRCRGTLPAQKVNTPAVTLGVVTSHVKTDPGYVVVRSLETPID